MAVVYSAALKTARMQLVSDLVAAKTPVASSGSPTAGSLVIGTSSLSGATGVLATFPLPTTPFTVAGAVATLAGTPMSGEGSASGTAAKAEIRDSGGNAIVSGLTVGVLGADVLVGSTTIVAGQPVDVLSGTITHG